MKTVKARLQEDVLMMPKERTSQVLFNPRNPRYMIKKPLESSKLKMKVGSWKWKLLEVGSYWKLKVENGS